MINKPVIATTWFDRHGGITRYSQYSKVWRKSAKAVFGDSVELIEEAADPPDFSQPCPVFYRGSRKIGKSKTLSWLKKIHTWEKIITCLPLGVPILMIDIDTMFFSDPFDDLKQFDFDVGICGNNTGAIYFSGSQESHKFMHRWRVVTEWLFNNKKLYQHYDKKYKGLDQASMGYLLESGEYPGRVLHLPRRFHSTVEHYELPCHIMHYHSRLRAVVFGDKPISILPPEIVPYAEAWRESNAEE